MCVHVYVGVCGYGQTSRMLPQNCVSKSALTCVKKKTHIMHAETGQCVKSGLCMEGWEHERTNDMARVRGGIHISP